jgi:hypothetical protein
VISTQPIFVLCPARSGSTLLRYLLRSHPQIACPAESNLALAFSHIFNVHAVCSGSPEDSQVWEPAAIASCRLLAERTMEVAAERDGKPIWCDKSLSAVEKAEVILKVFPGARLLTLYRNCGDFIASALEACPWGLSNFGFEPYARDHPHNQVLALVRYWLDRVAAQLAIEEDDKAQTHRVTYEDLVLNKSRTLQGVCHFLGLAYSDEYFDAQRVFDVPPSFGPQDNKINFTALVHAESLGRGATIPLSQLVPAQLLDQVIDLEARLRLGEQATSANAVASFDETLVRQRLEGVAAAVQQRFRDFGAERVQRITGQRYPLSIKLAVVAGPESVALEIEDGQIVARPTASPALQVRIGAEEACALLDGSVSPSAIEKRRLIAVESLVDGGEVDATAAYTTTRALLRVLSEPVNEPFAPVRVAATANV